MTPLNHPSCDVLVIGSGAAGLSIALRLAPYYRVSVLSKAHLSDTATQYAQGGIAAVFDDQDHIQLHIDDTLTAGAGLCDLAAVTFVATHAKSCVEWLIEQGIKFDTQPGDSRVEYHLTQEGGHSRRRILHAADATGKAVETTLISQVMANERIHIFEQRYAIDLTHTIDSSPAGRRITGALALNRLTGQTEHFHARAVILATGGAARVYKHTTNPEVSCGDGIAMAWRAGCDVANLEFNQFHPTALYHPQGERFLLSEALRGEGALLQRADGSRFMPDYDPRGELAPRDIVAQAINAEMSKLNTDCMYLDISHKPASFIRQHFPNISDKLQTLGIDITQQAVPIVPAAHYTCGGVCVDLQGRTTVPGLYAIGEVSYTGLHGANRLASNSLLECLVYGWSAAQDIIQHLPPLALASQAHSAQMPAHQQETQQTPMGSDLHLCTMLQEMEQALRALMWQSLGIVRTNRDLAFAAQQIAEYQQRLVAYSPTTVLSEQFINVRNLVMVAELMVNCAKQRKESRGLHQTRDYPETLSAPKVSILSPKHAHSDSSVYLEEKIA